MTELSTAPSPGSTPALAPIKPRRRRFEWFPILMILPAMLVLLSIQVYPILYTIYRASKFAGRRAGSSSG